jgi:nicotinate-nucleotide adenylyltransferase
LDLRLQIFDLTRPSVICNLQSAMRIGVFGGTFDPPHNGHLRLAQAAREQLGLGRVLWAPAGDPPHKRYQTLSPIEDRAALVEAAIGEEPAFALSRVDVDRPGPHFSADTVSLLAEQFPDDELVFLMGGDSLRDLPTWGRPEVILAHCTLGVFRRPGATFDLDELELALPGVKSKIEFVDAPPLDVASGEIRPRVLRGQSLAGLMPEAVARLIAERGLYRDAESAVRPARPERGRVPDGYREVLYWKLTESTRRLILIQLLAIPLGIVAFPAFGWAAAQFGGNALAGLEDLLSLVLGLVGTLSLHELAHGVVMAAFGATPRYGIKWEAGALYATAPGYAFTRNQYLAVIFAPLLGLSGLAVLGMWALAGTWAVSLLAVCATVNAMGACGDVYMSWLVARYPASVYVIDEADGMRVFLPVAAQGRHRFT